MSKLIFALIFFIQCTIVWGQNLMPQTISSSGGEFSNNNYTLEWNLGETVINSFSNGNNNLTQGFLQPNIFTLSNEFIEENSLIKIFPNPFSNFLNIKGEETIENIVVQDISGRLVFKSEYKENIDLSFLIPGFYIITLYGKQIPLFIKLKIQKI